MPSDAEAAARSERSFLIDDAARLLGVSRRTVYYRIREGRLLTIRARCGSQRVLLSSIEALMRARQEQSQEGRQEESQDARQEDSQEGRQEDRQESRQEDRQSQEARTTIERAAGRCDALQR